MHHHGPGSSAGEHMPDQALQLVALVVVLAVMAVMVFMGMRM